MKLKALAVALSLGACASPGETTFGPTIFGIDRSALRQDLAFKARVDLTAAYQRAESFGDEMAMNCYRELLGVVGKLGASSPAPGPIALFQAERNLRLYRDSKEFRMACGPLGLDLL